MLWLVVWNIFFIFPYVGNSHPNWLLDFSEGLKPPGLWWICPQLDGLASASLVGGAAFVRMLAPALCFFRVFGWAHGRKGLGLCWRIRVLSPPPISIWSGQDHDRPWFPQNVPLNQPPNQSTNNSDDSASGEFQHGLLSQCDPDPRPGVEESSAAPARGQRVGRELPCDPRGARSDFEGETKKGVQKWE